MKHFLIYTALRITLFLVCWGVVAGIATVLFGDSTDVGIWSFVGGCVLALALSYPLLAGPRERFAESIQERAARAAARMDEMRASEDAD